VVLNANILIIRWHRIAWTTRPARSAFIAGMTSVMFTLVFHVCADVRQRALDRQAGREPPHLTSSAAATCSTRTCLLPPLLCSLVILPLSTYLFSRHLVQPLRHVDYRPAASPLATVCLLSFYDALRTCTAAWRVRCSLPPFPPKTGCSSGIVM